MNSEAHHPFHVFLEFFRVCVGPCRLKSHKAQLIFLDKRPHTLWNCCAQSVLVNCSPWWFNWDCCTANFSSTPHDFNVTKGQYMYTVKQKISLKHATFYVRFLQFTVSYIFCNCTAGQYHSMNMFTCLNALKFGMMGHYCMHVTVPIKGSKALINSRLHLQCIRIQK